MHKKSAKRPAYSYTSSVKSSISDEWINTYLLRPVAGLLVRILYSSPVTPNQVTVAAIATGVLAAVLYALNTPQLTLVAGVFLALKDLLDTVDGQLARAKQMYSRMGRFLDSIGDAMVNLLVFAAIASSLHASTGNPFMYFFGLAGFLGISLRVSYHVFYQTSYLHLEKTYTLNRTTEEVRSEDLHLDRATQTLQRIFGSFYGWQDNMMVTLDRWCADCENGDEPFNRRWYGDYWGLRLSGLLGLGTELFLLVLCSVTGNLRYYFALNICMMNFLWGASIIYRRCVLLPRVLQRDK